MKYRNIYYTYIYIDTHLYIFMYLFSEYLATLIFITEKKNYLPFQIVPVFTFIFKVLFP